MTKLKLIIIGILILTAIIGCSEDNTIKSTKNLLLSSNNLNELNISSYPNNSDLKNLNIELNEDGCKTEKHKTNKRAPLAESTLCSYKVKDLNNTDIIIQIKKYTNLQDLNGSYQYSSLHLRSSEGIISENEYGDQSRFSVNHENDYMGELNPPGIYYYHLWITKDKYLIHITSDGSKDAKDTIVKIAEKILSKF